MELVRVNEGKELVVSLDDISRVSGVQYESIRRLLINKKDVFMSAGVDYSVKGTLNVDFKSTSLNEKQAMLLMMFMKNTPVVESFKIKLVEEFFKMRELIKSGGAIPEPIKQMYSKFVPKDGYMEANSQGDVKSVPVRGYFRADSQSAKGKLLKARRELMLRANGLFQEEIRLELEIIEEDIKGLENE